MFSRYYAECRKPGTVFRCFKSVNASPAAAGTGTARPEGVRRGRGTDTMHLADMQNSLVRVTERVLTWRRRRRLRRKEKQKRKNQILDWIQALLWAAVVVLIVNQYVLQAYAVPSASMEDTIQKEDRLFVDKMVYGPELVPGYGKLPGAQARRGEIIVFLNPNYFAEMGRAVPAVEELFNRLIYMLTFTLVNRDINAKGEVAVHFLVKRLIGLPGEQVRMRGGRIEVKQAAENGWTAEETLKHQYQPLAYTLQKKFYPYEDYPMIRDYVTMHARLQAGLSAPANARELEDKYIRLYCAARSGGNAAVAGMDAATLDVNYRFFMLVESGLHDPQTEHWTREQIADAYHKKVLRELRVRGVDEESLDSAALEREYKKAMLAYNGMPAERIRKLSDEALDKAYADAPVKYYYPGLPGTDEYYEAYWSGYTACAIDPANASERNRFVRRVLGWYIPTDRFWPMGDNRDNSKDARWFGSVRTANLLGRSLFRFWPIPRIGAVR